jgi:hypothetical protein
MREKLAVLSMMALAALALSAPRASAWGVYYLNASNPNCTSCHPGFQGGFGASLHDNHLDNLVSGPCTTCHTGSAGSTPVPTGTDDPDEFTGCVGCHGRDADAGNDGVSPGRAAGLRQHHPDFAKCAGCHSDANPANYTPVGEDTLPRFYVAGLAVTNDPCSDNLDNDGNDLYDGDDDACAAPPEPPTSTLDHFLCYKARRARGEERFEKRVVELSNQFQERRVEISKSELFCNPVEVTALIDDEVVIFPIIDPAARLTCYQVRRPVSAVKPQVISTDPYGEQALSVQKRRTQLCVPSQEVGEIFDRAAEDAGVRGGEWTKSQLSVAEVPSPSLDHFEFYKARRKSGTPRFERREVHLADQFLDETVELKKPVQLGVPTDKNGEDIFNPSAHLTCYSLRPPKFEKRDVEMVNQFSGESEFRLTVRKPNMLCVPSDKQVVTDK